MGVVTSQLLAEFLYWSLAVGLLALAVGLAAGFVVARYVAGLSARRQAERKLEAAGQEAALELAELKALREESRAAKGLLTLAARTAKVMSVDGMLGDLASVAEVVLGVRPAGLMVGVGRGTRVRWFVTGVEDGDAAGGTAPASASAQAGCWTTASVHEERELTASEAQERFGLDEAMVPAGAKWCLVVPVELGADVAARRAGAIVEAVDDAKAGPPADADLFGDGGVTGAALLVWTREQLGWGPRERGRLLAKQLSPPLQQLIADDISARNESRLRVLFDVAPLGLFLVNRSLSSVKFNAAGAEMFGIDPATSHGLLAGPPYWELRQDGQELPVEKFPFYRAAVGGERVVNERYTALARQTGKQVELLISAAPIRRPGELSETDGAVVVFVDIGELIKLQEELEKRRQAALDLTTQKSRFFAAVSHDIRNPANAINLLAEVLMQSKPEEVGTQDYLETVKEIRACATRLSRLVGDVLDITRLDLGKVEITPSVFELGAFLMEEAGGHRTAAMARGLQLELRNVPTPLMVRTDRTKVSRILSNLISNAIKFTDSGTVWVTAEVVGGEVVGGGGLRISVHDTGRGVPLASRESIFDEFTQMRRAESQGTPDAGVGLGLSISRRLARAIGGDLVLEAAADGRGADGRATDGRAADAVGATFTLVLPEQSVRGESGGVA